MYLYFLLFLQLSYFYLINDILYNSTKEKYFNFSVYVNLIKLFLPKILKLIFKDNEKNIPIKFIQNIDEIFKIWRDKWKIFDIKYFKGLFIYTFNYTSYINIEQYYGKYIKDEIDKYMDNIEKLNKNESEKIKILALENGLDIDNDLSEIIIDLQKIKKMEIIINLSKEIDGNEFTEFNQISEKETSKIQRILKTMNDNFNVNNDNNKKNIKDGNNKDEKLDSKEKSKSKNNEEIDISLKEDFYNDLDGEPL